MAVNEDAIQVFGEENKNISSDSFWHNVDGKKLGLLTYFDYLWIRSWFLNDRNTTGYNVSVFDVRSGKWWMIRCLADRFKNIVGIEPYESFLYKLRGLVGSFRNLLIHRVTFADYARYISDVNTYFDDDEYTAFFQNAKSLLFANRRIIFLELGSDAATRYSAVQVKKSSHDVIPIATNCDLVCDCWGQAYPPFLTVWLYNINHNLVIGYLYHLLLKPVFFPFWSLFSKLNLRTRFKLSRRQETDYMSNYFIIVNRPEFLFEGAGTV